MADALDAPTVYRTEAPTLGQPVLSLVYRQARGEARVSAPLVQPIAIPCLADLQTMQAEIRALRETLVRHARAITALRADVVRLSTPWYRRLWAWLRARFQKELS